MEARVNKPHAAPCWSPLLCHIHRTTCEVQATKWSRPKLTPGWHVAWTRSQRNAFFATRWLPWDVECQTFQRALLPNNGTTMEPGSPWPRHARTTDTFSDHLNTQHDFYISGISFKIICTRCVVLHSEGSTHHQCSANPKWNYIHFLQGINVSFWGMTSKPQSRMHKYNS